MKIYCPICQQNNSSNYIEWNKLNIYNCERCDLSYCSEMKEKELGGNSSPVDDKGIKMMAESFFTTSHLANEYALKRVKFYEALLKKNCSSILELGCGPGVFYEPLDRLGIRWNGLEINPFWINFGKKNKIPISSTNIKEISRKYDVVTSHQVLEHVEKPNEFIKNIYDKLVNGGLVHLELPNHLSLTSRMRKISPRISKDYGFIQPPMHLRAYSIKTLKFLLEKNNFQVIKVFSCANNDSNWGQVRKYKFFKKLFYSLSGFLGLGSLLIAIAKKRP